MRAVCWIVAICAWSVTAAGQTPTMIDLAPLGLARADVRPVEADGNPATAEWLARDWDTGQYRVLSVCAGGVRLGPPFDPRSSLFTSVDVQRQGARDVLLVRAYGDTILRIVYLDAPGC